jgi:CxxC-x17-CxxC domain-containing protein
MYKSNGKGGFKKGGFKGGRAGGQFAGKGFSKGFGKRSFGKKKSFGGRDGDKPAMHSAVCDKCKQECEVPFKPSGDRPVFCSNCFKKPGEDQESFGKRESFGRRDFGARPDTGRVPTPGSNVGSWNADQFKKQFDVLNTKLDRIIKFLDPGASTEMFEDDEEETGPEEEL